MKTSMTPLEKTLENTEKKHITSAKLAEMVDLSHDFIRQIQSDKVRYNFSVETLYKISIALNVSLVDLVKKEKSDLTKSH